VSSTIDPATWTRPPTTFIFTVDISGSMGWGRGTEEVPTPGRLSRSLMHALADELEPHDQVAIVTYGSDVSTPLTLRSGSERSAVHDVIDVRVIVFTDVQPNVGATEPSEFEQMVRDASK